MGSAPPDARRWKILVVGVGGQGVLTAARTLGETALAHGMEPMLGQLHGMSQRGGSVESSVLLGEGSSSFITDGSADLVLGFEPLEALRAAPRMSAATRVVVNLGAVVPPVMSQQGLDYPPLEMILDQIRHITPDLIEVDGPRLMQQVGNLRSLNILMLGVLAGLDTLPFDSRAIWATIERRSPAPFLEPNRRAFDLGLQTGRGELKT